MSNTPEKGMKAEYKIIFTGCSNNPFDHRKKTEIMQKFARLPMDEQDLLEKIIDNPKALAALKTHQVALKNFLGI